MYTSVKASQLYISLIVASTAPLLLLRYSNFSVVSLWSQLAEFLIFSIILLLFFLPAYFLLKNTNEDIFIIAHRNTPFIAVFLSELYIAYFVFASVKILKNYSDMMTTAINSYANSYVISFYIMAVCIYAAIKGMGAVTRSGIFIFAIFIICFLIICFCNISKIELNNFILDFNGVLNKKNIFFNLVPILVSAPIFAVLSGNTKGSKGKGLTVFVIMTIVITSVLAFFTTGVLGVFSAERRYSFFTLSKVSGFDSLYLITSVASVILLIALLLVSINKSVNKNNSFFNTTIFSVLIYVLFICAENISIVSEIIYNEYIFLLVTFLFSIVIPLSYLPKFGRNKYGR